MAALWILAAAGTYLLSSVFVVYTLLFGQSEFHRGGFVGMAHNFLTGKAPSFVLGCCGRFLPRSVGGKIMGVFDYLVNQQNPVMASFYVMLVLGGYVVFYYFGAPYLPNPYVTFTHMVLGHVFVWSTVGWFFHVMWSDPGVVTKENAAHHMTKYTYDPFLYGPRDCKTCTTPKPPRSKHCAVCNRCVARFDHHCPWINNDVGALNTWKFLLFLFATGAICAYASLLSFNTLAWIVEERGLLTKSFPGKDGTMITLSYGMVFQWVVARQAPLAGLCMFTGMISLVMFGFFSFHLYLVYKNTTTNETSKWKDIARFIERNERVKAANGGKPAAVDPKKPIPHGWPTHLEHMTMKDLKNSYDRGFRRNMEEVLLYNDWKGMAAERATHGGEGKAKST